MLRVRMTALLLLLATTALAAGFQTYRARCVAVLSGDTLVIQKGVRRVTVHLAGVSAPEPAQPFGEPARQALAQVVQGREIVIQEKLTDRGGVVHAVVLAAAETTPSLNALTVQGGFAWCDPASHLVRGLGELERQARAGGSGLWRDPQPVPPWEWRQLAAAGKLPKAAAKAVVKKQAEPSTFDELMKTPVREDDEGLIRTVVEARKAQTAQEDKAVYREFTMPRQQMMAPYGYGYVMTPYGVMGRYGMGGYNMYGVPMGGGMMSVMGGVPGGGGSVSVSVGGD